MSAKVSIMKQLIKGGIAPVKAAKLAARCVTTGKAQTVIEENAQTTRHN